MLNFKDVFVDNLGNEVVIERASYKHGELHSVAVKFHKGTGNCLVMTLEEFNFRFKSKENKTINNDIIKLIESGYQFKTFWGTTFDGKEFHVEMQLKEDSQIFKDDINDLF